jgi:Bacterial archaeo-eukaryotic release factor family 10
MLTREQVEALAAFDAHGSFVLSVYLDLDPVRQMRRSYQIAFKDLVKEARALFSCTARAWFQAPTLAVRVRDHLAFEPIPDVGPLLRLLDEHERYVVAAVDKTTARIFSVFVGEIEEREALEDDEVPPKHDQGGLSQSRYQHHHETHVRWHTSSEWCNGSSKSIGGAGSTA